MTKSHVALKRPPFELSALPCAAGRWRARSLPGRCLSGAGGSQDRAELDSRHFHRRYQRGVDRRQSAGGAGRLTAGFLGGYYSAGRFSACSISCRTTGKEIRPAASSISSRAAVRRCTARPVFSTRVPPPVLPAGRHHRGDQLLTITRSCAARWRASSISTIVNAGNVGSASEVYTTNRTIKVDGILASGAPPSAGRCRARVRNRLRFGRCRASGRCPAQKARRKDPSGSCGNTRGGKPPAK